MIDPFLSDAYWLFSSMPIFLQRDFYLYVVKKRGFQNIAICSAIVGSALQLLSFAKWLRIEAHVLRDGKKIIDVVENILCSSEYDLPLTFGISSKL